MILNKYVKICRKKGISKLWEETNVHPNFGRRYSIAQHYFEKVMLFTNALNDQVMLIEPRSNDTINYIFRFIFTIDCQVKCNKIFPDSEKFLTEKRTKHGNSNV